MKYIHRPLTQDPALSAMLPAASPDLFYLDIETTGLRADDSYLYLIGTACFETDENGNGRWMYHAWFGFEMLDEQKILREFLKFAGSFKKCISFSGKRFDVTYLSRCMHQYYLDTSSYSDLEFDDYVTLLRPMQNLLSISRSRLGEWEERIDRKRADASCFLSGGEMSALFQNAPRPIPDEVIEALLLHNMCDLQSLVLLKRLLSFGDLTEKPIEFTVTNHGSFLTLTGSLEKPVPVPIHRFSGDYECRIIDREVLLTVYESTEDCKLFFPDYRNYVIVRGEDGVLHKDLASLIPKELCKKATPETCYQTVSGRFLPMPLIPVSSGKCITDDEGAYTVLRRSFIATCGYVRVQDAYNDLSSYGREFLRRILQSAE